MTQSFIAWTPEKGWHEVEKPLPLQGRLGALQAQGKANRKEETKQ